jgi:hypothetical protein
MGLQRANGQLLRAQQICSVLDENTLATFETVDDLTFGALIRVLENRANWESLGLQLDRRACINRLEHCRKTRNRVMPFDRSVFDPEPSESSLMLAILPAFRLPILAAPYS